MHSTLPASFVQSCPPQPRSSNQFGSASCSRAGSPSTSSKRLIQGPIKRASVSEMSAARHAQLAARQLRPVPPIRLAPTVDLEEMVALLCSLASLVAALHRPPTAALLADEAPSEIFSLSSGTDFHRERSSHGMMMGRTRSLLPITSESTAVVKSMKTVK